MSVQRLFNGAEALIACERGTAVATEGAKRITHCAAAQELEAAIAEFKTESVDGGLCRRVLIAVDDSEPATWAVKVGMNLARLSGARVALVHAIHGEMAMTPVWAMP